MNSPGYQGQTEPVNIEHVLETLQNTLPDIAHDLIDSKEESFRDNPDDPAEHSPRWHQYGILTHSEEFRKFIETDAPELLREWGIAEAASSVLSEKIDGTSKAGLLQVASLLHDVGKFTARRFERQEDGSMLARFDKHEEHSRDLIHGDLKEMLLNLHLSEAQINYIAKCAEHHFDLGKARKAAIEGGGKYTMEFAQSEAFKKVAQNIINKSPDVALEVGLMFMADSLSKTEVAAVSGTDEEIGSQKEALEQEIEDKGLDPRLINQALQQPVNIEIGKQYLQVWAQQ